MKKLIRLLAVTAMAWSQAMAIGQTGEALKNKPELTPLEFTPLELTPANKNQKNKLELAPLNSATRFHLETQRLFVPGGTQLQLGVQHSLNDTFGLFAYGEVHRRWWQIYAGPTFAPVSWLKIGAGIGVEQTDRNPLRSGNFLWLGAGKNSWLTIGNISASGHWWHSEVNHQFNDWFGAGLFAQSDAGLGPRFQITIPKKPITVWFSPTYWWENGRPRFIAGLRLQF